MAGYVYSTREASEMNLKLLPIELLLSIADFLDTPSKAALSLTCKDMHANLGLSKYYLQLARTSLKYPERKAPERDRIDFLQLLEKDNPALYLCHSCRMLKRLSKFNSLPLRWSCLLNYCHPQSRLEFSILSPLRGDYDIEFHDAYLVMKRHLYGAEFGLPLSSLSFSTPWELHNSNDDQKIVSGRFWQPKWFRKLDITPFIHQDQLLILKVCRRQWFPPEQRWALRRFGIGDHSFNICTHLRNTLDITRLIDLKLRKLPEKSSCSNTTICGPWRCPLCPTEFTIIVFDHGCLGLEVAVDSWHNLGFCRAMDDPGWASIAGKFSLFSPITVQERFGNIPYHSRRWLAGQEGFARIRYVRDLFSENTQHVPEVQSVEDKVPDASKCITRMHYAAHLPPEIGISTTAIHHESAKMVLEHWNTQRAAFCDLLWKLIPMQSTENCQVVDHDMRSEMR